jgi:hypothetical protein
VPCCLLRPQVPERLATLRQLLGGMSGQEVLAVTRRCPVVLGVHSSTLQERAQQLCRLLGRSFEQQVRACLSVCPCVCMCVCLCVFPCVSCVCVRACARLC